MKASSSSYSLYSFYSLYVRLICLLFMYYVYYVLCRIQHYYLTILLRKQLKACPGVFHQGQIILLWGQKCFHQGQNCANRYKNNSATSPRIKEGADYLIITKERLVLASAPYVQHGVFYQGQKHTIFIFIRGMLSLGHMPLMPKSSTHLCKQLL